MKNFDNMTDLERIEALKLESKKHYYEFRHLGIRVEIQKEQIKELNHKLIEQEIELAKLIKKLI
jgi:hypothetical protein